MMTMKVGLLLVLLAWTVLTANANNGECDIQVDLRFDCYPGSASTAEACRKRGCCWKPPAENKDNVPYCFYSFLYPTYIGDSRRDTKTGFAVDMSLIGNGSPYGGNILNLTAEFMFETKDRLHVKIYDPSTKRYEVPIDVPNVETKEELPNYIVTYQDEPFSFKISRLSDGEVIFNTAVGGFIYSDQFIQISSLLSSSNIYGLGEHVLGLNLDMNWSKLTLFARDAATPEGGVNLYGVHPFYVNVEKSGMANGVFLKNSNAMDILLQPSPAITYRTIGGILDFYFFMGPSVDDVVSQYTEVVGRPMMPPYWSLGFHLCRWGYNNLETMAKVREGMEANGIPQDVQWNDIEYMQGNTDFTVDNKNFHGLSEFVDDLHEKGMHYVLILDPAISNTQTNYSAYKEGLHSNVFIKYANNVLVGKVWPGTTVFPDFTHPNASSYWFNQIKTFHDEIRFDGLWIDMNEPSNFVDGSTVGCPGPSTYENPPYVPGVIGGKLNQKTICMNSQQHVGRHYDLHSMYGHTEAVQTNRALSKLRGKRPFVVSRSTFSGTGKYANHWLGDNQSTWESLYRSIAGIINFNLFGIPMVGADICGFQGDTTEELCLRWMQLGAFYPFSRNHNTINTKPQDPVALGNRVVIASKNALTLRYTLLPYLYTLFYRSHVSGELVTRGLFAEFPTDTNCLNNDQQFMWGGGLLFSPVLHQGASSVTAYLPAGRWFEYYTGGMVHSAGQSIVLPASFERVNVHVREGNVIPIQYPGVTTTKSRANDFGAIAALDSLGEARGELYLDDGERILDNNVTEYSSLIQFQCSDGVFSSTPFSSAYTPPNRNFNKLVVFGVNIAPTMVLVNGNSTTFHYDVANKSLRVSGLQLSIVQNNLIRWIL